MDCQAQVRILTALDKRFKAIGIGRSEQGGVLVRDCEVYVVGEGLIGGRESSRE